MSHLTLLIFAGIVYFIIRQFLPQKVQRFDFVTLPILAAINAYRHLPDPLAWNLGAEFFITGMFSLVVGAWQGYKTKVHNKEEEVYIIGGFPYLLAWIMLVVGRLLIKMFFEGTDSLTDFTSNEWLMWSGMALTSAARGGVLYLLHPEIGKQLKSQKNKKSQ
ncbi:hypothetical protein ACFO4N_14780 [Camelliibacillus cellulosilyticus]|uniref:Membrane protein CcdC involved in cytochrome C biogenesis n=1 Tax=Camelliibacillus cellulosilyticus TaxID=2174486 RepID=A0ABV9GP55_9BACL